MPVVAVIAPLNVPVVPANPAVDVIAPEPIVPANVAFPVLLISNLVVPAEIASPPFALD